MWYVHTMEYYSSIKRNVVLKHATTWMNLENVIVSKIVLKDHILYDSIYMKCPDRKIHRDKVDEWLLRDGGVGESGHEGCRAGTVLEDESVLKWIVVMVAQL